MRCYHDWRRSAIQKSNETIHYQPCYTPFFSFRSSHQRCSIKKGAPKNFAKFTGKHLCQSLFFNKVAGLCNFIKNKTLVQVFSCEFLEIFNNTLFTEHLRTTASVASIYSATGVSLLRTLKILAICQKLIRYFLEFLLTIIWTNLVGTHFNRFHHCYTSLWQASKQLNMM